MNQPGHPGIILAWATDHSFDELKDRLANLSAIHSAPPTSLSMIPFRSSQGPHPTGTVAGALMDRVSSASSILSVDKKRGADVEELSALAAERHISIDVFYPIDAHKAVHRFAEKLTKNAKGGCISQEYRMHELPVLLKAWIDRQVAQSEGSTERIAQSYSGKHWMDAFGGFQ